MRAKSTTQPPLDLNEKFGLGCFLTSARRIDPHYRQALVAKVASAYGLKEDSLYDCILVARMWSKDEFDRLVGRTGPFGFRLSFSHFVVAARWSRRRGRSSIRYAKQAVWGAVDTRLSVRSLKKTLDDLR